MEQKVKSALGVTVATTLVFGVVIGPVAWSVYANLTYDPVEEVRKYARAVSGICGAETVYCRNAQVTTDDGAFYLQYIRYDEEAGDWMVEVSSERLEVPRVDETRIDERLSFSKVISLIRKSGLLLYRRQQ